jgi:hypothetical protein
LSCKLSEIEASLEDASSLLGDKMRDGDGGGDGSGGGGGGVRIKAALKQIKTEIKEMSSSTVMLQNALTLLRLEEGKLQLKAMRKKKGRQQGRGGPKKGGRGNEDDDD